MGQIEGACQGGARVPCTEVPVWLYQGPLPWPGEECQSPFRGVRAGEYRSGETATIANITGVMRLWQAERPELQNLYRIMMSIRKWTSSA